ncbi:MAG: carboxymuconolactone decarboxylase family protein [Bacteroidota bacterium]
MIAIGASIGENCLPCLRHHFAEAVKAGCTLEEIEEAIELSKAVKERPIMDIYAALPMSSSARTSLSL